MGNDLLLCLKRYNNNWRMDHETLLRFILFTNSYFKFDYFMSPQEWQTIVYAEISSDDLKAASVLFGTYLPDEHTLYLVPLQPSLFLVTWRKSFIIHLFKNTSTDKLSALPVLMAAQ